MTNTKSQNTKRRNDIILIVVLLAVGLISWGALTLIKDKGAEVIVKVDGEQIGTYSLNEDQVIPIESEEGTNTLVIENGEAYVDEADCRDGLCVKQGKISKDGESIVCLPHKTVISIESDDESQIDGGAQ